MADQGFSETPTNSDTDAPNVEDERLKSDMAERLRKAVTLGGGPGRVSEKSGVPLRTLNNYMSGRSEMKATAVVHLAQACGVAADWLLTGQAPASAAPSPGVDERLKEIMAALDVEDVPVSVETLRARADIAALRDELEAWAARADLPDQQRGFADLLLRLAFNDAAAANRARLREERLHAKLRASGASFQKAVDVVGVKLSPRFEQAFRTLMFTYDISVEDAISVLDALSIETD